MFLPCILIIVAIGCMLKGCIYDQLNLVSLLRAITFMLIFSITYMTITQYIDLYTINTINPTTFFILIALSMFGLVYIAFLIHLTVIKTSNLTISLVKVFFRDERSIKDKFSNAYYENKMIYIQKRNEVSSQRDKSYNQVKNIYTRYVNMVLKRRN
jgi:hypothetical protein